MTGFLFEQIIFGPVRSRRLGISLGVNLLPLNHKQCTFNCLYCECGWTKPGLDACLTIPSRQHVRDALDQKLQAMKQKGDMLTTITFAGNGEPTLHPEFGAIIEDAISLRDAFFPDVDIAVLSNASLAGQPHIAAALQKVDLNILKLDAGTERTFRTINMPGIDISLQEILHNLSLFKGQMVLQTLFVRGSFQGVAFDNTTEEEVSAWLGHVAMLQPRYVMIYPVARATPADDVEVVSQDTLHEIARRVEALGIATEVY